MYRGKLSKLLQKEENLEKSTENLGLLGLLHLNKYEASLVIVGSVFYLLFWLFNFVNAIIIFGFIIGAWYISRPSEWLYRGVNNLRIYFGLREYIMGVLSAFAAIAAEIFIVSISVYYAYTQGVIELLEIAVLSTLFTMSFNILILGLLAIKVDSIPVALSEEELVREMGIINWTMMASFLLAFLALVKMIFSKGSVDNLIIPQAGAVMLPLSYVIYVYFLKDKAKVEKKRETKGDLTVRQAIIITIIGVVGSLLGSEMIVESSRLLLELNINEVTKFGNPVVIISLIIGISSAIHDLILNIFFTVKEQLSATVGNLVGSTIQLLLLILGILGIFIPLPLTDYIIYELLVLSTSLCFIRISISDKKVDDYDGALLVTLQILSLALLFQGF